MLRIGPRIDTFLYDQKGLSDIDVKAREEEDLIIVEDAATRCIEDRQVRWGTHERGTRKDAQVWKHYLQGSQDVRSIVLTRKAAMRAWRIAKRQLCRRTRNQRNIEGFGVDFVGGDWIQHIDAVRFCRKSEAQSECK